MLLCSGGCSREAEARPVTADEVQVVQVPVPAAAKAQTGTDEPSGLKYDPRTSLAPMIEAAGPAVVSIRAIGKPTGRGFFGVVREGEAAGSGFILDQDGVVVTNHHVTDGAKKLEVRLADGRRFDATLKGSDPATDLAVLELDGASGLPVVELGESKGLRVGDWVVAIGNPMGLDHSASVGIISARGRGSLGLYKDSYIDFLQTDADIAPGSSGGPLFDLEGRVVGINTAVSASRAGFAIPVDQAKWIIPQLLENGEVVRGWLGASNDATAEAERGAKGAVLGQVFVDTPAADAGLQRGDVVTEIDGTEIQSFDDLRTVIAQKSPGHTALLKVERDERLFEAPVVLEERPTSDQLDRLRVDRRPPTPAPPLPKAPSPTPVGDRLGVTVSPHADGLEVTAVQPGSLAADLNIQVGDVLQELNGVALDDPSDVKEALGREKNRVRLQLRRGGVKHSIAFERS